MFGFVHFFREVSGSSKMCFCLCLGLAASICMWSTEFSFHSTNSAPEWTGGELFHPWYNFVFALKEKGIPAWDLHLGRFLVGGTLQKPIDDINVYIWQWQSLYKITLPCFEKNLVFILLPKITTGVFHIHLVVSRMNSKYHVCSESSQCLAFRAPQAMIFSS